MTQVAKEFLRYAISIGALEFVPEGRKLKSGRISPYFFNSGLFHTGKAIRQLASCYAQELQYEGSVPLNEVVLFGPAYKGIPLVVATSMALNTKFGYDVGYAFDRKEAMDHGEGGELVGCPVEGRRVIVIDDVITTGGSTNEAFEFIRRHGGIPGAVYIAFDREERGVKSELSAIQEFEGAQRACVYPIAKLRELIELFEAGDVPLTNTEIKTMLPLLLAYRDQYGVK